MAATVQSPWRLDFGARPFGDGLQFRVWAPRAERLALQVGNDAPRPMAREDDEVFAIVVPGLAAGTDYRYLIDNTKERPDPVSRSQPNGVHGASRVVDPESFTWSDRDWKGLALDHYVIYELHVGTFTTAGTFNSVLDRLDYLRDVGVTAVELMPVAEFPGTRNWGYDGVNLYAPHHAYGGSNGLKLLVDACHTRGLAVILDVVYNHLGPEGNYLCDFGPYFTNRYRTPWGDALNFDGPLSDGVRRFFVDNALHWLVEYHVDALRLDAVHGIFDFGARHILEQIAERFHATAQHLGRRAYLIAESDLNDARIINPVAAGGYGLDAQWNDDFHHALHTVLTGDRHGYFADFGAIADLRKAVTEGFVYDGRHSVFRQRRHGNSAADRPGNQFVSFSQNHDQIANGSAGQRLAELIPPEADKLAAMLVVCAPNLPMLFMGQEFGATSPFFYFTSFADANLAQAVSEGRQREYGDLLSGRPFSDPQSSETFARSRLDWQRSSQPHNRTILDFHRTLLSLRRLHPCLANCRKDLTRAQCSEEHGWITIERGDPAGSAALVVCNLRQVLRQVPLQSRDHGWRLALWNGEPRFGGSSDERRPPAVLAPSDRAIELGGFGAALYLVDRRD